MYPEMKFHETLFEEYVAAVQKFNLHPELTEFPTPAKLADFGNLILYGPSGVGKYSQMLRLIQKYSPSELKYDKRMTMQCEKHSYTYRISDIHYEVDMGMLGCNSVMIWHEVFTQIVDIVSLKPEKCAIIVCKNFHAIHTELLNIFYTYMQQYNNHPYLAIQLKFILLTEHVSFLPTCILDHGWVVSIQRPSKDLYQEVLRRVIDEQVKRGIIETELEEAQMLRRIDDILPHHILNLKELHWFATPTEHELPPDLFNIVCDALIRDMLAPDVMHISNFRDKIYDILVYHLDGIECVWYILSHFIETKRFASSARLHAVLDKTYFFLKHYNNNYRPIYHLENILFSIMNQIHGFDDDTKEEEDESTVGV